MKATTSIPLNLYKDKHLQQRKDLKPGYWQKSLLENEIQSRMEIHIIEYQDNLQKYCYNYVMAMFIYLSISHDMDREIQMEIDHLNEQKFTRICSKRGVLYPPREIKCDHCSSKVISNNRSCKKEHEEVHKLPKYFGTGEKIL